MPVDPNASVRISAFNWVPPFAQGQVRDLRPRWALEEAGIAYAVRKLDATTARPAEYYEEQPFGQVPSYQDEAVSLFESGAIVLYIARDCETLLPREPAARARATAWLIAALNSVEPFVMQLATIDIFAVGEDWAKERRPQVIDMIGKRLSQLANALGDKPYLDGDAFTVGDLMMTSVLRGLEGKELLERHENLIAYQTRCLARPAFQGRARGAARRFRKTRIGFRLNERRETMSRIEGFVAAGPLEKKRAYLDHARAALSLSKDFC